MAWDTAGNIINDAAVDLGLASVSDPFASTDPNFVRLCRLLKRTGRELVRVHPWSHLQQIFTFTTASGTSRYSPPQDFDRFIDGTAWNRSNRLPLGQPLSPQEWEYLRAQLAGVTLNVLPRFTQGQVWIFPDTSTPGSLVLAYEYISSFWCQNSTAAALVASQTDQGFWRGSWAAGTAYSTDGYIYSAGSLFTVPGSGGTSGNNTPSLSSSGTVSDGVLTWQYVSAYGMDAPTASADTIFLDRNLATDALRLAFKEASGFDASAEQKAYDSSLEKAINADTMGVTLNLNGRTIGAAPLISGANAPSTGYGS